MFGIGYSGNIFSENLLVPHKKQSLSTIRQTTSRHSGGSRNCKTRGRSPGAVEFLGIGFVLTPLHTYPIYVFVARVVNKIDNVDIVC